MKNNDLEYVDLDEVVPDRDWDGIDAPHGPIQPDDPHRDDDYVDPLHWGI